MKTLILLEWLFWLLGNLDNNDNGFIGEFSNSFFEDSSFIFSSFLDLHLFFSYSVILREFFGFILSDLWGNNCFSEFFKLYFLYHFILYFLVTFSVTCFVGFLDIFWEEFPINEFRWLFFIFVDLLFILLILKNNYFFFMNLKLLKNNKYNYLNYLFIFILIF